MALECGIEIPLVNIFSNPTIKGISKLIKDDEVNTSYIQRFNLNTGKNNIFAFPPIFGYGVVYQAMAKDLDEYVVNSFDFIESEKDNIVDLYIKAIKEIQSEGPYTLIGYFAGGLLAYKVAEELEVHGEEVDKIIILDSYLQRITENDREIDINSVLGIQSKFTPSEDITNYTMKMDSYYMFVDQFVVKLPIAADVYLIKASTNNNDLSYISDLIKGNFVEYTGYGTHYQMLSEDSSIAGNVLIIKNILSILRN